MKLKLTIVVLAFSAFAFAQHGGGHGAGVGGGAGHIGGPSSMGSGMGSTHGQGQGQSSRGAVDGKQSPSDILSRNTKLSSNLEKLLPKGMTAQQACSGFKNLGQCVAAIHVSHNLGISFDDLKAKMTGTTPESLGKAIGDLKPDVNAKSEAKKANKQAEDDLRDNS